MSVLMVLTSHGTLGIAGKKTGFWPEEFAAPSCVLADAGAAITLALPKGGQPQVEDFASRDRPMAAVCHAPAIFRHAKGAGGKPSFRAAM